MIGHPTVVSGLYTGTINDYAILFTGSTQGTLVLPLATSLPGITWKIFNTSGTIIATGAFVDQQPTPFTISQSKTGAVQLTSDGISSYWTI